MNWSLEMQTLSHPSSMHSIKVTNYCLSYLDLSYLQLCLLSTNTEYGVVIAEILKFKLTNEPILQSFYMALAEVS